MKGRRREEKKSLQSLASRSLFLLGVYRGILAAVEPEN